MFGLTRLLPVVRSNVASRTGHQMKIVRKGHDEPWFYRESRTTHKRYVIVMTEGIMGFMWYWMLFHLYYDFGHITGHFEYPTPAKWTNAELGIPADDED